MNKRICALVLGAMFAVSSMIFAQDSPNLLKNGDLMLNKEGQLADWTIGSGKFSQEAGYKGKNSVLVTLASAPKDAAAGYEEWRKEIMTQVVNDLKPGKYIFTAYVKLNRKIKEIVLIRIITLDAKRVYEGTSLKAPDQPEPGVWGKVICEFNIPAGVSSATIAFDLRDSSAGATVCVDSPSLTYKSE
jgi:hypothetical protein